MNAGVALTCTKCACAQFIPQMWSSNKCMTCFHAVTSHAREGDAKRVAPPDALLQRSMIRNSLQRQQSVQVLRSPISQPQPQQQPQQQQQVVIAPPGSPKPPLPVKKKRGLPINTNVNVNATSRDSSSSPSPPPPPEENTQHTEVPGTPPSPPPGTPPLPDRVYDRVPNVLPPLPTKGAAAAAAAGATTTTSPRPKPLPKLPPTTVSPRRAEFGTIYSPYTPLEVTAPIELQTALTTDVLRDYRRSLHLFSGTLPAQYRELGESDSKLVGSELLSTLLLTAGVDAENAEGLMDVVVLPHVQQVPRVLPPAQLAAMRTLVGDLREYARAQRVLRGVTLLQARVRGMLVRRRLARVTRGSREQLRRCTAAYSVLLRTETTFVTDLSTLVNEYVLPLRNLQWTEAVSVFGNVEELLRVHRLLLADLNRIADFQWPLLDSLGDAFLKATATAPLDCVVGYVEGYGRSMSLLQTLRVSNAKFGVWLDATHDRVDEQRGQMYAGVEALLATPINRTTAYVRALSLFANEFVCDEADRASLRAALAQQSKLADTLRSALEHGIA